MLYLLTTLNFLSLTTSCQKLNVALPRLYGLWSETLHGMINIKRQFQKYSDNP